MVMVMRGWYGNEVDDDGDDMVMMVITGVRNGDDDA